MAVILNCNDSPIVSKLLLVFYPLTTLSRLMTKPTKWHMRPAKSQISLGISPVWSESSLSTWKKLGSLVTHWAHSEDSDQTGRTLMLIWDFAWRAVILFVLSWGGSIADIDGVIQLLVIEQTNTRNWFWLVIRLKWITIYPNRALLFTSFIQF